MAVQGGTVSHYYILVIRKFIGFCRFSDTAFGFPFSVKQFHPAEFGICTI